MVSQFEPFQELPRQDNLPVVSLPHPAIIMSLRQVYVHLLVLLFSQYEVSRLDLSLLVDDAAST